MWFSAAFWLDFSLLNSRRACPKIFNLMLMNINSKALMQLRFQVTDQINELYLIIKLYLNSAQNQIKTEELKLVN